MNIWLVTHEDCAVVILKHPTKIFYKVQCGGMICNQKQIEGCIITSLPAKDLPLRIESWGQLEQEDKDVICNWFASNKNNLYNIGLSNIEIDMHKSLEAFVEFKATHADLGEIECVLSWENCD